LGDRDGVRRADAVVGLVQLLHAIEVVGARQQVVDPGSRQRRERALAIIAIAAPAFRDDLRAAARRLGYR
jgi:acyl-CoA hydrolase